MEVIEWRPRNVDSVYVTVSERVIYGLSQINSNTVTISVKLIMMVAAKKIESGNSYCLVLDTR